MTRLILSVNLLCISLLVSSSTLADDCGHCSHCCVQQTTTKVCRLKVEEKKVEIVCWGCETEEFCVPGPSTPKCTHCECVDCKAGTDKDGKPICSKPKKFVWKEWLPSCAKVFTKKKLMKRTVEQTVPSYKWVVEDVCAQCKGTLAEVPVKDQAFVPPVPLEYQHLPRLVELPLAVTMIDETDYVLEPR